MAAEGTAPVETDKTGIGTGSHAIAGPLGAAIPGPPLALRRAIGAQPGARPGRGRGGGRGRGRGAGGAGGPTPPHILSQRLPVESRMRLWSTPARNDTIRQRPTGA